MTDEIKDPIVDDTETKPIEGIPPAVVEDEDDEEILAMRDQVQGKIDAKAAGSSDEKKFSEKDFERFAERMEKKFSQNRESEDEDFIDLLDPNAVKRKFVRIARLSSKFIVGLKNMNTDPYIDTPINTVNVEHPTKKGEYVPWSTYIYEDGSEELYPVLSFMGRAGGVWAEVIDEKKEDISEKFGLVDVKEVDGSDEWNMKSTGKKVLAKALKYRTIFVVKEIKTGKTLEVAEDVINKVEAPYSELKKFLEETK